MWKITGNATAFLSTPSARRATDVGSPRSPQKGISIHALREEGDVPIIAYSYAEAVFLSTPSARRATQEPERLHDLRQFLSTPSARRATERVDFPVAGDADFYPRPPRGGRLLAFTTTHLTHTISIHALREEGDWSAKALLILFNNFYPRPPRGGRRLLFVFFCLCGVYFYPRPPRGGRRRRS